MGNFPQKEAKKEGQEESVNSTFLTEVAEGERLVNGLMTKRMNKGDVGVAGAQSICFMPETKKKRRVFASKPKVQKLGGGRHFFNEFKAEGK